MATLEAFSFDAHRIPGRVGIASVPMSLRGDPSKGIEKERGGARAPVEVGRAFFVLQTGSIFSQKAGEHRGNRLCLRRLSALGRRVGGGVGGERSSPRWPRFV